MGGGGGGVFKAINSTPQCSTTLDIIRQLYSFLVSPEDVPATVFSSAIDSDHRLEEIDIAWDTEALESVIEVNIVVRGYRESNSQIEFSGTEITLAANVDYQIGSLTA